MAKKLMWFTFSAEAAIVRGNVRERKGKQLELSATGEDKDISLEKLSEDTRNLVLDAADAVADELGATVYQRPEESE